MTQQPEKKSRNLWGYIAAVLGGFIFVCCLVIYSMGNTADPVEGDQSSVAANTPDPANTRVSVATRTPKATGTPKAGTSRSNPVFGGAPVNIGGDMTLKIVSVLRPADDVVINGNMFNSKPEQGLEYLQVEVASTCEKSPDDKCGFISSNLKAVGSDGLVRDTDFVAGVDGALEFSTEFFGGSTIGGKLFYLVPIGDEEVVLFYERLFGDPVYLALR